MQEPILASDGEILAEPVFWFKENNQVIACFGNEQPGAHIRFKLEDAGIEIIIPGEEWDRSS
ncbi:MAG: hypothetical protein L0Y67_08310 [Gammaproteobacteria bacterium]|nr:hypothetical protein [Gammaproteobacteria bacterium]